jgi:uncharacterized protein YoxC
MIQSLIAFAVITFVLLFINLIKVGNKVIHELEEKEKTSYTSNEL